MARQHKRRTRPRNAVAVPRIKTVSTTTTEPLVLKVSRGSRGSIYTEKSGSRVGISRKAIIKAFEQEQRVALDFSSINLEISPERLRKLMAKLRNIAQAKGCGNAEIELRGINKKIIHSCDQAFKVPLTQIRVREQGIAPKRDGKPAYFVVFAVDPWQRQRAMGNLLSRLIKRDGNACAWCSSPLSINDQDATLDHVLPRSVGGRNSIDNYLLTCADCNHSRGDMPAPEWLQLCLADPAKQPRVRVVEQAFARIGL
jgi:hypothetical protein